LVVFGLNKLYCNKFYKNSSYFISGNRKENGKIKQFKFKNKDHYDLLCLVYPPYLVGGFEVWKNKNEF